MINIYYVADTRIETHIIEDHAIGLYLDDKYKDNMMNFDTHKIFIDHII